MNIVKIGFILETIGTILIALMALSVHRRFLEEHKVDNYVFKVMRSEQVIGKLGIGFVVAGFIFQIMHK